MAHDQYICTKRGITLTTIKTEEIKVLDRAIEMLKVASEYINNYPDFIVHYDEADCDGYCVIDDCLGAYQDLVWVKEQCEEEELRDA